VRPSPLNSCTLMLMSSRRGIERITDLVEKLVDLEEGERHSRKAMEEKKTKWRLL
jgi:Na+/phosphate symporter